MSKRGPLFTIAAVALLGLILIAVNVFNGNDDNSTPTASTKSTSADRSGTAPSGDKTGAGATGNDDTRNDGGPAGDLFPSKGKYVGTLPPEPSGTMTLSVTVDGDKALAYACDGDTVESWLSGSAKDGKLDLTGKNNARMTGTLDGTDVVGVLNLGQKQDDLAQKIEKRMATAGTTLPPFAAARSLSSFSRLALNGSCSVFEYWTVRIAVAYDVVASTTSVNATTTPGPSPCSSDACRTSKGIVIACM